MSACWRSSMCSTTPKLQFLFFLLLPPLLHTAKAQPFDYPTANLSSKWTNTPDLPHTISFPDGSLIKVLLLRQTNPDFISSPSFACGFYCPKSTTTTSISCDSFLFAVIAYLNNSYLNADGSLYKPGTRQVAWSADSRPFRENATLEFTQDGNLILKDVDGSTVWSTFTSGQSVLGMNLTEKANLELVDGNGKAVWQSDDHPTAPNRTEDQLYPSDTSGGVSKSVPVGKIVRTVLGALLGLSIIIGIVVILMKRRNRSDEEVEDDEDHIDRLPGMSTRFSYEELKVATDNFFKKLGQGGFGAVFEGTLTDGTKIAVKRLDNVGPGKREFLSEVETIGSIHHVHLVRLVGFCTWRSHRLLVYEYMSNGSLDKWIFRTDKSEHRQLDWQTKCKIINHVAKGLLYLHQECRQRIAHLDIKPQNILLDHNFDAKVSDFGLSKLIERDQSAVMTRMRGTPGYLAPEWLTSVITEKVDVYSFGVLIIEVVCGRKNLDYSKPEESNHLLRILMEKAEQGKMSNFVEEYGRQSVEVDQNDVEKMLRLAIWCLQSDTDRRPSMSSVVKVMEGSLDVDQRLNYNMWATTHELENKDILGCSKQSAPPLGSVLSGPR